MRVTGLASLARRGYITLALRTDEVCRVVVSARMSASRFGSASLRLPRGQRTVIRLRADNPRAVARALRTRSRTVAVRLTATDASGNARTLTNNVRAKRR
jgi:hypothetical protein